MKKIVSLLSAFVLATGALLPQTAIASSAVSGTMDTLPYIVRFSTDSHFVSSEAVAAGNVTIPAAVYLSGSTANKFGAVSLRYNSDSNHVFFQNMATGATRRETEQTYQSSMGSFTTNLVPYCFGRVTNGRYISGSPMFSTREYACDPAFGSYLYSTGDGKVKFTASYYADSSKTNKITKDFICDVTVDADGNGTYTYDYIEQSTFMTKTMTVKLPRYDATLPAGSMIPDTCNSVFWIPGTSGLASGASFLGETSDEFPLFQMDVVVEKETPCGIYNIDFSEEIDPQTGIVCQISSATQKSYVLDKRGTAIAVGVENVAVTSITVGDVAYYASYDTHAVEAADFGRKILADVTYTDGRTETDVDITRLVDCNGATPKDLFQAASNGYFASDVPLYFNGKPLTDTDNNAVTQRIMIGTKGDLDYDGVVTINDAFLTLMYSSQVSAGNDAKLYNGTSTDPNMETLSFFLADTDTCSKDRGATGDAAIEIPDAFNNLTYSSIHAAGATCSWDRFIK